MFHTFAPCFSLVSGNMCLSLFIETLLHNLLYIICSQEKNVMQLDSYEADNSKSKSEFIDCTGEVDSVQQLEKLDTNNEAAIQVSNDAR